MRAPLALYPTTHKALMLGDNPRSLPVVHVTDIVAECRACGGECNLCDAGGTDVDALMTQAWICPQCREAKS